MRMGPPVNDDRVKAQFEGRRRYHGRPCKNCGGTEKYVENYLCCECAKNKARIRAQERKASNAP